MTGFVFAVCVAALVFVLIVGYYGIIRLIVSLVHLSGYAETLQNSPHHRQMDAESAMPISVILPQCDADVDVVATVIALMELDYPEYEVIALCDTAQDKALPAMQEAFGLTQISQPIKRSVPMEDVQGVYRSPRYPNLVVISKPIADRSDALNTGVNASRYPLFVTLSAGRRLGAEGLLQLARPFMLSFRVAAVGGLPRIEEDRKGLLASLQRAEYLRSFPAGLAVPGKNHLPLMPDAYGAFRKAAVIGEGGFARGADETDMVMRLYKRRKGHRPRHEIQLLAEPVFETEPTKGLGGLFYQRRRWQREMTSSLVRNRGMALNAVYGRVGLWDIPSRWLFDVIGPVLEVIGCIVVPLAFAFGVIDATLFWWFLAAEVLFGIVISLAAVVSQQVLESDHPNLGNVMRLLLGAVADNILYRQLVLVFQVVAMVMPRPKN